jgi:hypothetical protein
MANEALSTAQLKELVKRVVVAQGNNFIKDLLRESESKIGATKQEFAHNLNAAIDEGRLTQARLEAWLAEVEGWGDQYVYVVSAPQVNVGRLAQAIQVSPFSHLNDAAASLEFPEELELKQIAVDGEHLSLVWHQGKEAWNRWSAKDFDDDDEIEHFRYLAYRHRLDRSVVRFQWRFGDDYCLILIHRNPDIKHHEVFATVNGTLALFGCEGLPLRLQPLMHAIRTSSQRAGVKTTRFERDSGYVELGSSLPGLGIEAVESVRVVLQAVDTDQFDRANGMLNFVSLEHGTSRDISVEIFGAEAKLRIWAQCKREDVLTVLELIWEYNTP